VNNVILKAWQDPVWSKVIATGVLASIGATATWAFDYWSQLKAVSTSVLALLNNGVSIPVWLLIVIIPLLISLVPIIQKITTKASSEPEFMRYQKDNILGIDWAWDWSCPNMYNSKYSIRDLLPRCPNCKSSLETDDYSGHIVRCINDNCDWHWEQPVSFNKRISHSSELDKKVRNIIDRKIHVGEFKA